MSDLLIKGMEMPKDGTGMYCIVFSDGKACASYKPFEWHEVVTIPPHGRLIEKNAVFELIQSMSFVDRLLPVEFMQALQEIPTIIEVEEAE